MAQRTMQARLDALADVSRPENLEIATLTRHDIPALAALYLVAYDSPEIAENLWEATDEMRLSFEGTFGRPRDDSFVGAWIDGTLVGAILCVTDAPWDDVPRGPFIIDLMVDPERRREGIATTLITEIAGRCRGWGHDSLALRVDTRRAEGASQLYGLLGFTDITEVSADSSSTRTDVAPA